MLAQQLDSTARPRLQRPSLREVVECNTRHGFGLGLPYTQLAAATAPAWSAAAYPGYLLDYNSAQGVVLNGSNASAMADQASGYTASQGTANRQPPYSATRVNGQPGLDFEPISGTDRWLVTASAPSFTNASFYFVILQPTLQGSYCDFTSFNLTPQFYTINGHPGVQYGGSYRDFTDLTLTANTAAVFTYIASTSTSSITCYLNNVASALTLGVAPSANSSPLTIGAANAAGAAVAHAWLGRVLVYDQAHGASDRTAVFAGLQTLFSIP